MGAGARYVTRHRPGLRLATDARSREALPAPRAPRLGPRTAPDLHDSPSALVIPAGFDILRVDGEAYAAALQSAGSTERGRRFPALAHGFVHVTGAVPAACHAMIDIAHDFRALLDARGSAHAAALRMGCRQRRRSHLIVFATRARADAHSGSRVLRVALIVPAPATSGVRSAANPGTAAGPAR